MPRIVFTLEDGEQLDVEFDEDSILLGRHKDCDVQLLSASVSNRHARVMRNGGRWFLSDLGSTNGSSVAGTPAAEPVEIRDGDKIRCGDIDGLVFLERIVGEDDGAHAVAGPVSAMLVEDEISYAPPPREVVEEGHENHPRRKKKPKKSERPEEPVYRTGNSDIIAELNRIRRAQHRPSIGTWFGALILALIMLAGGLTLRHYFETGRWSLLPELFQSMKKPASVEQPDGGDA